MKPRCQRRLIRIVTIFTMLLVTVAISLSVLYKHNKYVKYYFDLPGEVRCESVRLLSYQARNFIVPYKKQIISTEEEATAFVTVLNAVQSGAQWLVNMQESSGRFNYWYHPVSNTFSQRWDDNFLRQAGTAYSMVNAWEITGDSIFRESYLRSINYLMTFKEEMDPSHAYFLFNEKAKLGGIALPMLAILKHRELSGDKSFDKDLKKMANMIIYLQDQYGTGQFKSTYVYLGVYDHEKRSGWESKIYPGEALYALSEMYRQFGDNIYKERFDWAMEFYDKRKYWGKSSFMPWTISALANMAVITKEKQYADFALKIAKKMVKPQNMNYKNKNFGSWHALPMVSSATCLEALGDLIYMTKELGLEEETKKYTYRAKIGNQWLMQLQYDADDIKQLENGEFALGGFPAAHFDQEIRIDNTQHSITALCKGLKYIYGYEPEIKQTK